MNPFQVHAANMKVYEALTSEPVNGQAGNSVTFVCGDPANPVTLPAVVGVFTLQQMLQPSGGGFTPTFGMLSEAIIQKDVVPAGVFFKTGLKLTARQIGGSVYQCQVFTAVDTYTEWRLQLQDVNYRA